MAAGPLQDHRRWEVLPVRAQTRALRVLTMTTCFPSDADPRHGIFVETRLRKLRRLARGRSAVIAPVPWFPFDWRIAGRYAAYAATPRLEQRHGAWVRHPRFLSIPRVGMAMQPAALASASLRAAGELLEAGWRCDVIDAHYLYPTRWRPPCWHAAWAARSFVTARGSDVNLIAQMPAPRRRILAAWRRRAHHHGVRSLEALPGRDRRSRGRYRVLRTGSDMTLFSHRTRCGEEPPGACRRRR